MGTLITRIGARDNSKRSRIVLTKGVAGMYSGTIAESKSYASNGVTVDAFPLYGVSLFPAMISAFHISGVHK